MDDAMTVAVCSKCGTLKFGAFFPCGSCHARPTNDHEFVVSFACSDHYLDRTKLEEIGSYIRHNGEPPEMIPEAYDLLHNLMVEAKTCLKMNREFGDW